MVVKPGWRVTRVAEAVRLDRVGGPLPERDPSDGAVALTLFSSRVTAIAEQMGERLQRLARSVNIRERRDFSCAVFDADGMLVVNAPHVPVHLGAMGETVRTLLARQGAALGPEQPRRRLVLGFGPAVVVATLALPLAVAAAPAVVVARSATVS